MGQADLGREEKDSEVCTNSLGNTERNKYRNLDGHSDSDGDRNGDRGDRDDDGDGHSHSDVHKNWCKNRSEWRDWNTDVDREVEFRSTPGGGIRSRRGGVWSRSIAHRRQRKQRWQPAEQGQHSGSSKALGGTSKTGG